MEETHYYPFGLTMAGISSKALAFGEPENKYKYNGIEQNNDFDLNVYDARYRNLDPQIGRFWQVDPKIESFEALSPYAAMMNNPIRYSDPLGDSTIPGAGFLRNLWEGIKDGGIETKKFIGSLGTLEGWKNLATGVAATVNMVNGSSPEALMQKAQFGAKIVEGVQSIPNMSSDELGHAVGYGAEKVGEAVLLSKGAGMVKNAVAGAEAVETLNMVNPSTLIATENGITWTKSTQNVASIMNSAKDIGITRPIDVFLNNGKSYIVNGHHRAHAASRLGINVPVNYVSSPGNYSNVFELQNAAAKAAQSSFKVDGRLLKTLLK
ncbi:MAG: ParB N-terminal domain-containing protein [Chitinophagaceae bacterium]|nr:ParB N-terminal domain-containing protein [Chitinophagaceae bacterium]